MQSVNEDTWSNFRDSINSDLTRQSYEYCLNRFLLYCDSDLESLLKLEPQKITNLIIKYISELRLSFQFKNQILCAIKHACEMNDVLLNWRKIKKKDEPRAPDDEKFLSCYECGNTFGIHETHFESKIKDSVQTTDNPFDNESTFLSTESRATQRRKNKGRPKSKRFGQKEKIDPDIASEKGIVNILYDSKH